jgi:hypothetical protein
VAKPAADQRPATYADVEALPDHVVGEILDGEMHVSPRPRSRHALAAAGLLWRLGPPFHDGSDGPGGWWLLSEPELHLGNDIVVPDLAGWRRERLPLLPDVPYFTLAPDWLCEVVSPSTERLDRGRKLGVYAREGVPYVWLVNPVARTLEILVLEGGRYSIFGVFSGAASIQAPPFEAIAVHLDGLWLPETT